MFQVTEKANEMIKEFFKTREKIEPLRIYVAGMGCSGPQLGMALDESNENDNVFENAGLTFIVEKKLMEEAQTIEVDYLVTPEGEGFMINSGLKQASNCGGCTSCH